MSDDGYARPDTGSFVYLGFHYGSAALSQVVTAHNSSYIYMLVVLVSLPCLLFKLMSLHLWLASNNSILAILVKSTFTKDIFRFGQCTMTVLGMMKVVMVAK